MANLKNITELPLVDSIDGINLIVNDNGAAKQVPADAIGKVKTINGFEPDENGNVEIEIPEGFSGSWNDLSNKPFYAEEKKMLVVEGIPDMYGRYNPVDIPLEIGKEYIYFIDGIKYTGIGYYDESSGPSVDLKDADDTVVAYLSSANIELISSQLDITISHKIELVECVVHKLDTKYLPNPVFYIDAWYENSHITTNTNFYDVVSAMRSGALIVLRLDRSSNTGRTSVEYCTNFTMRDDLFNFQTSDFPVILTTDHIYEDY